MHILRTFGVIKYGYFRCYDSKGALTIACGRITRLSLQQTVENEMLLFVNFK